MCEIDVSPPRATDNDNAPDVVGLIMHDPLACNVGDAALRYIRRPMVGLTPIVTYGSSVNPNERPVRSLYISVRYQR